MPGAPIQKNQHIAGFNNPEQTGLIDPLTQLYDIDYLQAALQRETELHHSQQRTLSLLVVDIDNFRNYNRRFGLACGDTYLSQLGELLSNPLRNNDVHFWQRNLKQFRMKPSILRWMLFKHKFRHKLRYQPIL